MPLRATTPLFSARSWLVEPMLTLFSPPNVTRIFWRCSHRRRFAATWMKTGQFVITNKERNHRSTIYKVDMPYFMRLSCLDFGMHAGIVPNYPASHGCIRLPSEAARKFFSEIPIGTLVTVQ